jgi:hypothetical protein
MPEKSKDAATETVNVPASVVQRVRRKAWWSLLLAPVETLVALAPSHKNTKKGRQSATQIRIALIAVGVIGLAFGGETIFIMIGGLIMALGLVIPMSDVRKRTLMGNIKRLRGESPRDVRVDGEIAFDGKRLSLKAGADKLRRILLDRDEHRIREKRYEDHPCIEIRPGSGGKAKSIWICSEADAPDAGGEQLERSDVDAPAFVSADDFRRLTEVLRD